MNNETSTTATAPTTAAKPYSWEQTLAEIAAIYTRPDTRSKEQIADDDAYAMAEYICLNDSDTRRERDEFFFEQQEYSDPVYREVPDGSRARKH